MFVAADWVVKSVMIGLAFASVVTWTIWLLKSAELAGARLGARSAFRAIGNARDLAEAASRLSRRRGGAALLAAAALQEMHLSADIADQGRIGGIKERIEARLSRIEAAAVRRLARGTGLLASIGATAPFVGLFGTVWGIMNAFIGISEAETTNLAVVGARDSGGAAGDRLRADRCNPGGADLQFLCPSYRRLPSRSHRTPRRNCCGLRHATSTAGHPKPIGPPRNSCNGAENGPGRRRSRTRCTRST
jgi:tonB-system energizer ExbB